MAITSNCAEIIITNTQGSVAFNKLITTTELSPAKTPDSEDRVYLIQNSENAPQTFWWNLDKAIADGYADLQELYDYFVSEIANQCGGGGFDLEDAINAQTPITDPNTITNATLVPTNEGSLSWQFMLYLIGGVDNNGNTFNGGATYTLNTSSQMGDNIFNADVLQNVNCEVYENEFAGRLELCNGSFLYYNTFQTKVSKVDFTTMVGCDVVGNVDRLLNCVFIRTGTNRNTFGGRLEWCVSILAKDITIDNDFVGNNFFSIVNTTANCKVGYIIGISNHNSEYGFDSCTITGTTSASVFGNFNLECKITGKTIDEASYPELFNANYAKRVFKGSDGNIYYTYFNGLTYVINQII
jgi:hypothetical protein